MYVRGVGVCVRSHFDPPPAAIPRRPRRPRPTNREARGGTAEGTAPTSCAGTRSSRPAAAKVAGAADLHWRPGIPGAVED